MRPVRIRLEGFSAYRSPTEADFTGMELFSLSGPTGAGKSSLIDAMIFALYGRIPRLGGRAVAPVITAGSDRTRVAFDFEVNGASYTASRVAERTKTGATVREARLEGEGGSPLASGADEVTRAVEELTRLRFDDFTKTVVLPQGEFARFLNAGSGERRELLRDLLGLAVYGQVREFAGIRRTVAADRAGSARNRLDNLDVPDEATTRRAEERLAALEQLSEGMAERQEELDRITADLEAKRTEAGRVEDALGRLSSISPPEHLGQLDTLASEAEQEEAAAKEKVDREEAEVERLEKSIAELPSQERIATFRQASNRLDALEERLAGLDLDAGRTQVEEGEKALAMAQEDLVKAADALNSARASHSAHALAQTLIAGEHCPVCRQTVEDIPDQAPPAELNELEQAEMACREKVDGARLALDAARAALTELETRRTELESQAQELTEALAGQPTSSELDEQAALLGDLETESKEAQARMEGAQAELAMARKRSENLAEQLRSVGRGLIKAIQSVAGLGPPVPESDDPIVQWKEIMEWRDSEVSLQTDTRDRLLSEAATAAGKAEQLRTELVTEIEALGVPPEEPWVAQVVRELETARHVVERNREAAHQKDRLKEELAQAQAEEQVAAALAGHLRADGFERWLMSGAIAGLVGGANHLLSQLSSGGYSLLSDAEGAFAIVDHRNADEVRPVSTLSGGEMFLVSLSLALSLAETLSSAGGARLDAIILDEGFGTLDEESLDTVATVLEELAGRGLMVGVITHVKELAARAPSRFEVVRGPAGSKVVSA